MQPKRLSWTFLGQMAGLLFVVSLLSTAHAQYYGGAYDGNQKDAPINVSSYPADIQHAYKTFRYTCSECHTLARAFDETSTPATAKHWVEVMQAKPAADFSDKQAQEIIKFLNYYHAHPPEAAW